MPVRLCPSGLTTGNESLEGRKIVSLAVCISAIAPERPRMVVHPYGVVVSCRSGPGVVLRTPTDLSIFSRR